MAGISPELAELDTRTETDFNRYLKDNSTAGQVDKSKVVDEASATAFIKEVLSRDKTLSYWVDNAKDVHFNKLIQGSFMQKLISENLLGEAQRLENRRSYRARRRDELRTHRDTRGVTRRNIDVWQRRPARMDLRDVDTRRPRRTAGQRRRLTPLRTSKWVRIVRVKANRQFYQYRDVKTGRFIKAPKKRR